jgi:SWI/SNF-related matrix-associated actin-dependent regulator of chromatin subfamily A-like protein 1
MLPYRPIRREELFKHQDEGASWLAAHRRAGLHDDMGYGKTATAITALDRLGFKRGIVVCPATIKENWKREFEQWSTVPRRYRKGNDLIDCNTFLSHLTDVMIISYEMATRWHKHLMGRLGLLDFMIFDEAHRTKNPDAKRTIALKGPRSDGCGGIAQFASYCWEITGTPIPNDPLDLYTFLKFCGAIGRQREDEFARTYFDSTAGRFSSRQTVIPAKAAELRALVQSVSLRRVGAVDLPPLFITNTFLDGDSSKVAVFLQDHPGIDRAILRALDGGNLNLVEHSQIMTLRRLIGEAKAVPFAYYLLDLMKAGLKFPLVFGWHKNVLTLVQDILTVKGYKIGRVDGDCSEKQKDEAIQAFQRGDLDGMVCNIQAGGEGTTLTRSKHMFMLESGWSPKDNAQAIKRIHRIGQKDTTRVEFITLAGSYDEEVVDIVRSKVKAIFDANGQEILAAPV